MKTPGYNNGENFIKALSSFWSVIYQDSTLLDRLTAGYGEIFSDAYFCMLESILGSSIEDVPTFNRKKWYFLAFRESENLGESSLIYAPDGILYGPQTEISEFTSGKTFEYGEAFSSDSIFEWVLPREMVDIDRFIMNRIHSPSLVLTKDTDFLVKENFLTRDHTIRFAKDPFTDNRIPKRNIRDSKGNLIDREFGLWALNSFWDYELVWQNFGKLISFHRPNSENYKTFVQAVWSLFIKGPNSKNVEAGINALLGLPVSRDSETIQEIITEDGINIIITNLNIYKIPTLVPLRSDFFSSAGLLKPEIKLEPFEPLTGVIEIKDSVSDPGWWNDVNPLILPKNLVFGGSDFLLPENVLVYADMLIGSEFGLPLEYKAPNEFLRTLGLRVGEWVIGDNAPEPLSYKFDYKDYIMNNFMKENLFFLSISPTIFQLKNFDRQVVKIIFEAIPAYTTFINYTFLDRIADEYTSDYSVTDISGDVAFDVGSSTGFDKIQRITGQNTESELITVGIGIPLAEEVPSTDTEDGYNGLPFIGFTFIGGFTLGTLGFNNGLLVRSICGN